MRRGVILLFVLATVSIACMAQRRRPVRPHPGVPAEYRQLYSALEITLNSLDEYLATRTPSPKPMIYAAELLPANANRGEALLRPDTFAGVKLYLDRLEELGVTAISVSHAWPQLDPSYPRSAEYLEFHRRVAAEVKRRGLKLNIGIGPLFTNTPFSDSTFDYSRVSFSQYRAGKKDMAALIVRELSPDYLVLGAEPDTEAALTGIQELNDPASFTNLVQFSLAGLDRGRTKVGAGIGTWGDVRTADLLARETTLDFLSIHVYPIWKTPLQNFVVISEVARRNGKGTVVEEAWLYKALQNEDTSIAANEEIFRRDIFSFWAALDQRFLTSLSKLSRAEGVEMFVPFWSNYYFAYVDYDNSTARLPFRELSARANQEAVKNIVAGRLSPTGEHYRSLIRADSD